MVRKAHMDVKVHRAGMVVMDLLVNLDVKALWAQLDRMAAKVQRAPWVDRDHRAHMVPKDPRVTKDARAPVDQLGVQVHKENLVKEVHVDRVGHRGPRVVRRVPGGRGDLVRKRV